jgi:glycosyltransferase involved in cell wall biosynthesis
VPHSNKLSIITVVFNGKTYLKETIQTVKAQTYTDIEYIVIDGGSTDGTIDIIKSNLDRIDYWISEPDKGLYDAMNKGIKKATGNWVCFLNAGDTFYKTNTLETVFNHKLTEIDFLYGDTFLQTEEGGPIRHLKAETLTRKTITKGMIACHQTMIIKKEKCPFYKDGLRYKGDFNWVCDVLFSIAPNRILKLDLCMINYKMGGISQSDFMNHFKEYLRILRERFGWRTILVRIPRMGRRLLNVYIKQGLFGINTLRLWTRNE